MPEENRDRYKTVRITKSEEKKVDRVLDQRGMTFSRLIRDYIKRLRVK